MAQISGKGAAGVALGGIEEAQYAARLCRALPVKRVVKKGQRQSDRGGMSLQQVADSMGCTRENIRLIERRALQHCTDWCARHGYQASDLLHR